MTTYDETTAAALLEAGAVLPPRTTSREDADTLTVRTYTHPALDERPVVRLVPGTLGEAEDLALEFLGLTRDAEAPEVGQVRKETLGFPAWALVHDPANGHHALALVKDVERLARQAKSRPGTAKDGFEELGERLGRAVPHFLPTFYEQAARVFLQHENTTYAAAFFGKAREAERVHALTVDEDRQRAVFLEFAFAGALTVKALKEHVKALSQRLDPGEAWAQYRQLTVERCAAGMPPYASLPQDARSLIKAAGLDRVTEECALVADLIASPAAVRAPASFWNTYRATLAVLAKERPETRVRLLEIMPSGLGRSVEDDEFWLELLAETGADRLLTGEDEGPVDAADWLGRWATYRKHGTASAKRSPATLALVERMAPRLRADGRPVDLFVGRWYAGADLDLLDLCAAEGVPLSVPAPGTRVHLALDDWLGKGRAGRRDLVATAADPRLRRLLYEEVGRLGGNGSSAGSLTSAAAHPVVSEVMREWIADRADEFTRATGLPGARAALNRLSSFRSVAAEVNADAVARVAAHELAPLLGRTLRAGIVDELGWPALDEAFALLDPEILPKGKRNELLVAEAWPALILARGKKAVVVGPEGVLLEHELLVPVELDYWTRPNFRYTDGELLVIWQKDGKQYGYWSSRPSEVFTLGGEQLGGSYSRDPGWPSIPLSSGGRATGGRTLHAGDTVLPAIRPVIGDGTTLWRQGREGRRQIWLEYDPATGTHGRASLPAFLRSGIAEGATLDQHQCEVLPLQPGLEHTPFGTDGAVVGRWVRTSTEGDERPMSAGTPDGRTVTLRAEGVPLGALRLPGGAGPVVARVGGNLALFAADDTSKGGLLDRVTEGEQHGEFSADKPYMPPVAYWHALRPRDEKGSAALRALSDERAAELLSAGAAAVAEYQAQVAANKSLEARAKIPHTARFVLKAVRAALPEVTDERLLVGVTVLVRTAQHLVEQATALVAAPVQQSAPRKKQVEEMFADYRPRHGDDHTLLDAASGVTRMWGGWGGKNQWTALRQIRAVNHVLSGLPAEGPPLTAKHKASVGDGWISDGFTVPRIGANWPALLDAVRPLAYRAALPAVPDQHREALLLLFDAIAEGPLASGENLREVLLGEPHDKQERAGQVLRKDGRTVVILGCQNVDPSKNRVNWLALDHDPSGAFGAVAHFTLEREKRFRRAFPDDGLAAVARLIRDKGAASWRPEAVGALAAATGGGLGPLQAGVLLAALPQVRDRAMELLGLKPRQLDQAHGMLGSVEARERNELLSALLPADPADLWSTGPDVAAAGRVWAERFGSVVRIPEDILGDLAGLPVHAADAVLNPGRTRWVSGTSSLRHDKDGNLVAQDPKAEPGGHHLSSAVDALAALAYALPYGHALRAALPEGLAALRRRIADPRLLLPVGAEWTEKGRPTAPELRKVYGLPESGGGDELGLVRLSEALVLRPAHPDRETPVIRTAGLTGPDDPVFGLLEGLAGPLGGGVAGLRALLADDLTRLVTAGLDPEGPAGYAQDPTFSVPDLVTEVAAARGLSEDAAALYLQLLALPDPTDRNCARWTGWKPARLKKARAELAATDLVVEAKRARAGRTLFLPGPWRDLKGSALPIEAWKEGLYPVPGNARAVPHLPLPELFARAWKRVQDGEAPAYEELVTRPTRKSRRR
ncbi:hypothetical protein Stsp02_26710 [Streptomyces sp. NBRC 14336]|uniref:hypothetical protein n=1 Tax=Streptomyces sp. NBRC 14336 TaxID=3030992 RepID=UPI0024A18068|nr:hypothetical protein [Streptomyces sp. NBRC 14336]GLW47009.1 hypothetical protein Stsp02_26710 [Streptomyces sp. NBRC 14336]